MLENLPGDATVYVQNENELAAVGATNNLRGLAANRKPAGTTILWRKKIVKKRRHPDQ